MKLDITKLLLILLTLGLTTGSVYAQGVTNSAISGRVTDTAGEPLPGANIVAVHEPTGTQFGTVSRTDGGYDLLNLRTGGPYSIRASFVGFRPASETGINLSLGQTRDINFELEETAGELAEVEIIGEANSILNAERTGASANVDQKTIDRMPTVARSLSDFARLTPFSATDSDRNETRVAGRNNRFNNITIDGATLNDVFGLSATGAPGGQAGAQPISLDAIQEFNVDIAPYDVRYNGFTGGSINAITRSGTNNFEGSLRYLFRNESFVGELPGEAAPAEFNESFVVGNLGGPIIRNKLFFFANVEYEDESRPFDTGILGSGAGNIFKVPADTMNKIINIARQKYGYDPGGFEPLTQDQNSLKFLGKLDWNINNNHRLTLRHNYVNADDDDGISRSTSDFDFSNRQYVFRSNQNSSVAELRSTFGNNAYNEARLVYTRIRDERDVEAEPFPYVAIDATRDEQVYLGIDRFSQANALDQDLWEFTNNFSYLTGKHHFTLGTSNQVFSFMNLFIQDYYGAYEFPSISAFEAGTPSRYYFSYSQLDGNPTPTAEFTAFQAGFYAQDQYTVDPTLTLTVGLRLDVPVFPDDPLYNSAAEEAFGVRTDETPTGNLLWSPRFGFNWDASGGARTTQLRGGTGIFSGRTPFVWISNQFSNTGVDFARVDRRNPGAGFFVPTPDPTAQPRPGPGSPLSAITTSEINVTDPDFKFPQVWRTNVAIDQQLPFGIIGSLEAIYSKAVNDVTYRNLNLVQTGTSKYGRPIYGEASFNGKTTLKDARFTNAILLENTDENYEYSFSAMLRKQSLTGLDGLLAYTYNRAKNVNNVTSSRAISNWQYNENFDVNDPGLGTADFEIRHRILANLSYRYEYADRLATTVGLFYEGRAGEPFSWIYNGNANADTRRDNDLLYVPGSPEEIVLTSNNWNELDGFISDWNDLDEARGSVIERNTARAPWRNILDLNVTQQIETIRGQRVEISANLINVLNLLSSDWGLLEYVSNNAARAVEFTGYVQNSDVGKEMGGRTLTAGDVGKPIVSFDPADVQEDELYTRSYFSRWQLQLGIRYIF